MVKKLLTILLTLTIALPVVSFAARTDSVWDNFGTYMKTTQPSGMDVLINGANHYLNWGSVTGSSGYGIRDNGGTIECKNSGGGWAACSSAAGAQTPWAQNINGATFSLQNVGSLSATSSIITQATSTNMAVTGLVSCDTIDTDANGTMRCGTDATGGGGLQTPWASNINGGAYSLSNVGSLSATSSQITQATSTNIYTDNLKLSTLSGILKAISGTISTATAGLDYENPLTFSTGVSRAVNAITCVTGSGSVFGCITAADWNVFNNKVSSSSLSGLYPATTTANTWGFLQTFSAGISANAATSTNLASTFASSSYWNGGGLAACTGASSAIQWSNGNFSCGTISASSFPFTSTTITNVVATSTIINDIGGFMSMASSTFQNLNMGSSTYANPLSSIEWLFAPQSDGGFYVATTTSAGASSTGYALHLRSDMGVDIGGSGASVFLGGLISNGSTSAQNFNSASSTIGNMLITGDATGTDAYFSTSLMSPLFNFTTATGTTIYAGAFYPNFLASGVMIANGSGSNVTSTSSLTVLRGGTGASTFTQNAVIVGNGVSALGASSTLAVGSGGTGLGSANANTILTGTGAGNALVASTTANLAGLNMTGGTILISATSTNFASTFASSSYWNGGGLTSCTGASSAIQWSNGNFSCGAITSSSFPFTSTGVSTIVSTSTIVSFTGGLISTASSTLQNLNTTQVCIGGDCKTAWPAAGSGSFPFTTESTWVSTSTLVNFKNGIMAMASSTISALSMGTSTYKNPSATYRWLFAPQTDGGMYISTTTDAMASSTAYALHFPVNGGVEIGGTGTSTLVNGIDLAQGCFSIGGTCVIAQNLPFGWTTENTWLATSTLLRLGGGVMSTASSTFQSLYSTNASTTNLIVSSAGGTAGCATFSVNGTISNTGIACGTGGGGFSFTTENTWVSTSTLMNMKGGLMSMASSTFQNLNIGSSTYNNGLSTYKWNFAPQSDGGFYISTSTTAGATSTAYTVHFPVNGGMEIGGTGTSTLVNGIDLGAGCFSIGGNCVISQGSPYPFQQASNGTSTLVYFNGGLVATASSTIQSLYSTLATFTSATGTVATTTNLTIGSLRGCNSSNTIKADSSGQLICATDVTGGAGSSIKYASYVVAASGGDYTTIQAALTACGASGGGTIFLSDKTYAQGATGLTFRGSNCNIYGMDASTTITFTGATTLFKTNSAAGTYSNVGLHHLTLTGNGNASSVAIDASDMTHATYDDIIIDNVGTAIKLNDTQNITFYNKFSKISATTIVTFGINASSTNPVNGNIFDDIFIGCSANCTGLEMNNGNNNLFTGFRPEPGTVTGTVGIHLFDNSMTANDGVFDNIFQNSYIEANGTGIKIEATRKPLAGGVQRNKFVGGIVDANSTDLNIADYSKNSFEGLDNNFTLLSSLQGPLGINTGIPRSSVLDILDPGYASTAFYLTNNTDFAHNSLDFAKITLFNAGDSSNLLNLNNLGTGATIIATSSRGTDLSLLSGILSVKGGIVTNASSTIQSLMSTQATTTQLNIGSQFTVSGVSTATVIGAIKAGCFTIDGTTCLAPGAGGSSAGGTGAVQFANGTAFAGNLSLFSWDNTKMMLSIGTTTGSGSFDLNVWGRSKSAGTIDCLIPWPSGVAASADQIGTALIADAPCRGNYTFTVNTDATLLPWTLANEQLVTASGTPFMTRFQVNAVAGWAAASPELGILQSVMLGSATSSNGMGLAQEGWIKLPNVADATTSATYIAGGFSNVTNAVTVATVAAMVDNTEQCLLVASSTANWTLYTAVAGVKKVTDTGFATSSNAFKYLITLDQTGCKVYFNDNPTAAVTVTSIPTSHLRAEHGIGLTAGMTTGRAEMRLGHITNWLPYY